MIKAKHLLALSLAAVVAVPAFAEGNTIEFTGSITAPTCSVTVEASKDLGSVSTSGFVTGTEGGLIDLKVSSAGVPFTIAITDTSNTENPTAKCKSISSLTGKDGQPMVKMLASGVADGFLKNTAEGIENSNLGVVLLDGEKNKVAFGEDKSVTLHLTDEADGAMAFTAYMVAIDSSKPIQEQELSTSVTFSVEYN